MNRKIQFTLILIGWVGLILAGSILAGNLEINSSENHENFVLNTELNRDSNIEIIDLNRDPNKKIIIRIDDVRAWYLNDISITMIESILDRRMAVSAGVIPNKIDEDSKIVNFIKTKLNDPNFEIAQHGTYHTVNEFLELKKEEAHELIEIGREKIIQTFGYTPVTFIPPYNKYNEDTVEALSELGYRVLSPKKSESSDEDLLIIGYNIKTKEVGKKELNPVEDVIDECKNALDSTNLCVILIHPSVHPSDYIEDGKFVHQNEFFDLLNNLEGLNATFVTFKIFAT